MTSNPLEESAELISLDLDLDRSARRETELNLPFWEGDRLKMIGIMNTDCSAFNVLKPELRSSLREHLLTYARSGNYGGESFKNAVRALNRSLVRYPTNKFDLAWAVKAITSGGFASHKGTLESFFMHWQDRYPEAIERNALQFLVRPLARKRKPLNVLSDDPAKSWFTDLEYDTLLRSVWDNYDRGVIGTPVTLLRLLAMQYSRRPSQLASLKIGDFRIGSIDGDRPGERSVHFPGVKDRNAIENFRDSKEEVHPMADHLWDLFQIQQHEVRSLFEEKLGFTLTAHEVAQLPLFSSEERVENAILELAGADLRDRLNHLLFHVDNEAVSKILTWRRDRLGNRGRREKRQMVPISHRTGRPLKISATRLRHTRARQLARLGTPKHVLSFWLGHENERSIEAYYNDPAEEARQLDEAMRVGGLVPLAMAFTGNLLDDKANATRANDPESTLEFATEGNLKEVGRCGKHSFCATTSVPVPCYRCKEFEPLVYAPHEEVLHALLKRQTEENSMIKIGGNRKLLTPIDLSPDIRAVQACIYRCNARKAELEASGS